MRRTGRTSPLRMTLRGWTWRRQRSAARAGSALATDFWVRTSEVGGARHPPPMSTSKTGCGSGRGGVRPTAHAAQVAAPHDVAGGPPRRSRRPAAPMRTTGLRPAPGSVGAPPRRGWRRRRGSPGRSRRRRPAAGTSVADPSPPGHPAFARLSAPSGLRRCSHLNARAHQHTSRSPPSGAERATWVRRPETDHDVCGEVQTGRPPTGTGPPVLLNAGPDASRRRRRRQPVCAGSQWTTLQRDSSSSSSGP